MNMRVQRMSDTKTRKVHSASFKAKVALEALARPKTVNERVGAHQVHPNPVTTWKREAQDGLKAFPP